MGNLLKRRVPLLSLVLIGVLIFISACGGAPETPAPQADEDTSVSQEESAEGDTSAEKPTEDTGADETTEDSSDDAEGDTAEDTAAESGEPQRGGSATIGLNADILNFNGNQLSFVNYPVFRQCYNRLIKYDHDMEPQPELATYWEWSDDNLTLTLTLREGVMFHNGREFVADDVVQNFEFASDEETGSNLYAKVQIVESVEAVDDYTVEINLSEVTPSFLDTLDSLSIMAPESFENIGQECIGTGPFQFSQWIPGDQVVFERNEDYWRDGLPYLDEVIFKPYTDAEAQSTALESGIIDGAAVLPYRDYERLQEVADIERGYAGSLLYVLMLNPPDPDQPESPLSDKTVRQAIHYAVDRQALIDQALFGVGEATVLPFPETSLAYFEDLTDAYSYDLEKARELLAEAGHEDGFDIEIIGITAFPEMVDMSQILAADLEELNINAEVVPLESAVWTPRLLGGEYESTFTFIGRSHKDPLGLFDNSPFRTANSPVWPAGDFPEGYAEALETASSTADEGERREAFRQVQEIMLDQSVQIPISWRFTLFGSQYDFHGMSYTVDDEIELERAWLEQ